MINSELQKKLREKYNPDGSELRNAQLRMVEMLRFIDEFCKTNGINYWLSSGTCLGAVRHGGFIPWDDDLDIEMLRKDYLKFEKKFKETEKYVLQTHKNDKYYDIPFAKLRDKHTQVYKSLYKYKGVFIDIFSLEKMNVKTSLFASYMRRIPLLCYNKLKIKKSLMVRNLFLVSKFVVFNVVYPFCRLVSVFADSNILRHTFGGGWHNSYRVKDEIFPLKQVDFEGILVPIPGNYDKYLTRLYGNYADIPDEKDIQKPHYEFLICG